VHHYEAFRLLRSIGETLPGVFTAAVGLGTLLFGGSHVFTQLKSALNMIWEEVYALRSGGRFVPAEGARPASDESPLAQRMRAEEVGRRGASSATMRPQVVAGPAATGRTGGRAWRCASQSSTDRFARTARASGRPGSSSIGAGSGGTMWRCSTRRSIRCRCSTGCTRSTLQAPPAILQRMASIVTTADAYIVVSGEYNHMVPPALANLLDHFLEEYFWKPSAIVSYSAGAFGGVRAAIALRAMLSELGMSSIPSTLPVPRVQNAFSLEGEPEDPAWLKRAERFLGELEWYGEAMRAARIRDGKDASPARSFCEALQLTAPVQEA
jgi:NAD(P)H-dependent FMN reductase